MKLGKTITYPDLKGIALCRNCLPVPSGFGGRVASEASAGWGLFWGEVLKAIALAGVGVGVRIGAQHNPRLLPQCVGTTTLPGVDWSQEVAREGA